MMNLKKKFNQVLKEKLQEGQEKIQNKKSSCKNKIYIKQIKKKMMVCLEIYLNKKETMEKVVSKNENVNKSAEK